MLALVSVWLSDVSTVVKLVLVSVLLSDVSTVVKLVVEFPYDGSYLLTGCTRTVSVDLSL